VQIFYSSHRGSRDIEHIGSAHDDVELELLKAAERRLRAQAGGLLRCARWSISALLGWPLLVCVRLRGSWVLTGLT
jgi:hypothetical protein